MKYLKIILLTTLVVLGACKKDKEDIEKEKREDLSYVDKYSKGTVSFTLDGKEYTKEFKSEKAGLMSMVEKNYALYYAKMSDGFPNEISIKIGLDDIEFSIDISTPDKFELAKYPFSFGFDKKTSNIGYTQIVSDSDFVNYSTKVGSGILDGFVKVTKYDYDKRIIEGEFEGKLFKRDNKDENDVKIIKNGKFSVAFTL